VTTQTLLQVNSEPQYRGRVMSTCMLTFGLTRLGTIPAGAVADSFGVPWVISTLNGLFALIVLSVWRLLPEVRRLE
jgi:hypothetical protein